MSSQQSPKRKISRTDERIKPEHHCIIGATGSGKTQFIKRHPWYTKMPRVIAWDPEESYSGLNTYRTRRGFERKLRQVGFNALRARVVMNPTPENFEWFCELIWSIGHQANPMMLICEELADVCQPGKAGYWWGQVLRKGRKYGIKIIGVSQRPQEVDKTFFNSCLVKWCGILGSANDRRYMAQVMDLTVNELAPVQECEFYIRKGSKPSEFGRITFDN